MNKFSLQQCIGRGNFGDVYRAENNQSGQVVAIKVINLEASDEDVSSIIQEIQILSRMKSNHITKYFETLVCNMSMWIVMEYCGGVHVQIY